MPQGRPRSKTDPRSMHTLYLGASEAKEYLGNLNDNVTLEVFRSLMELDADRDCTLMGYGALDRIKESASYLGLGVG